MTILRRRKAQPDKQTTPLLVAGELATATILSDSRFCPKFSCSKTMRPLKVSFLTPSAFIISTLLVQPLLTTYMAAHAQSFWSSYGSPGQSPQQQQQTSYSPYMSSGVSGPAESYSPTSLFPPYNNYGSGATATMSQPFMYGTGGSASGQQQQQAASYNPYMQMQPNPFFPMMDALKMPGTT